MRNYVYLLLCVLLIASCKKEELNSTNSNPSTFTSYLPDSTYVYYFNSDKDSTFTYKYYYAYNSTNLITNDLVLRYYLNKWIGYDKGTYTYDANGNQTSALYSMWDDSKNDWYESFKRSSTYSSDGKLTYDETLSYNATDQVWNGFKSEQTFINGKLITYLWYNWNGTANVWENRLKYEYSYDEAGNQTLDIIYLWDVVQQSWENNTKYEATFNGNTCTSISYNWDKTTSAWLNYSKYVSTKNTDGKITTDIQYNWDLSNNVWLEYLKNENTYDSKGKLSNKTTYSWIGVSWVETSKDEMTYDANSRNLSTIHDLTKNEYTYDGKGNTLTNTYYQRDSKSSSWYVFSKFEYTYDSNNNLTSTIYSSKNQDSECLGLPFKYFYAYNSDNAKVYSVIYSWDPSKNDFVKYSSTRYFNSKNFVTKVRDINEMTAQMEKRVNEAVAKGMSPEKAFEIHAK